MGAWDWTKDIEGIYNDTLGRGSDPGGMDYWSNIADTYGLDAVRAGISGSDEAKNRGNNEGGGEEFEIPTNLFSTSFSTQSQQSGPPAWGNTWAKDYMDKYSGQIGSGLSDAFTALENPVALNEAQKAHLQYFANENLRPTISDLSYRGVLNSTTAKETIAKLLAEMGAKSYDTAMSQQQAKIAAYQKSQALLTAILEAARQSSGSGRSEASNPFEPWAAMLPYLLGE